MLWYPLSSKDQLFKIAVHVLCLNLWRLQRKIMPETIRADRFFSCKLWSLGCSLGTSFKCIFNVIWYTSIVKLFPILNYPWRFCLIAVFKSSFCILRLLYSLAVGSADQLILSEATSEYVRLCLSPESFQGGAHHFH